MAVAGTAAGLLCLGTYRQITNTSSGTRPDSPTEISSTPVGENTTNADSEQSSEQPRQMASAATPKDGTASPPNPEPLTVPAMPTGRAGNGVSVAQMALAVAPESVRLAIAEQGLPPRALDPDDPFVPVYSHGNGETVTNRAADAGAIFDRNGSQIGVWVKWMHTTIPVTNYGTSISFGMRTVSRREGGGL